MREAIFNVLQSLVDLDGAAVADLFAGSGALGIEALSRGAATCTFVESDAKATATIAENLVATGLTDRGMATVVRRDVKRWLSTNTDGFDVAFVDPPYAFDGWDAVAGLDTDLVVAESGREIDLGDRWEILRAKRYGSTVVTLFRPRESP